MFTKPVKEIVRSNEDFLAKSLVIGVTVDDIMAEVNVFDWMGLREANLDAVLLDFQKRLKWENPKGELQQVRLKSFAFKFEQAIFNLSAFVEEVHASYNFSNSKGVNNEHINRYYYLKYWADKKQIAVDYNETDYEKRKLFNFYTILFDIFADKLANFNAWKRQKEKQ